MAKLIAVIPMGPQGAIPPLTSHIALAFQMIGANTLLFDSAPQTADATPEGASPVSDGPEGLQILKAGALSGALAQQDETALERLVERLVPVTGLDLIMVETPQGVGIESAAWALAADMAMIVITPSKEALHGAFAMARLLQQHDYAGEIRIVPSQFSGQGAADKALQALNRLAEAKLGVHLTALPPIPEQGGELAEEPLMLASPEHPVAMAVEALVKKLLADFDWSEERSLADAVRAVFGYASNRDVRSAIDREIDETTRREEAPQPVEKAPDREIEETTRREQAPQPVEKAPDRIVDEKARREEAPQPVEKAPDRVVDAQIAALMERNIAANERLADALLSLGTMVAAGGGGARGQAPPPSPFPTVEGGESFTPPGELGVVTSYLTFEDLLTG